MQFLISLVVFASVGLTSFAASDAVDSFSPDKAWVRRELQKMGLRKSFIKVALESYDENTWDTVLKLNLLGFLQPPQHMDRVTDQSVRETAKFLKENRDSFLQAEKKYRIPPDVISALLWIETRHGDDRGGFHIVSVFLHLLQSDRPKIRKHLLQLAKETNKKESKYTEKKLRTIMAERTLKRHQWAREQILALAQIHKKKQLDLQTLKGSFAGAFGIAQFIPSSYRDFAKSMNSRKAPDLYANSDAIFSVANYLVKHGWRNRSSKAKISALMKYNNSRDYADSILEISKRVGPETRTGGLTSADSSEAP